jgi:hypothetical protein
MTEIQDVDPKALAEKIAAALAAAGLDARIGTIRDMGRNAGFDLQLGNGQEYRVQIEEM